MKNCIRLLFKKKKTIIFNTENPLCSKNVGLFMANYLQASSESFLAVTHLKATTQLCAQQFRDAVFVSAFCYGTIDCI